MMILGTFTKQPNEVLDYDIDFSDFLPTVDSVASVAKTIETNPDPLAVTTLVLGANSISASGKVVKQWVSAGTDGQTYKIQLTITSVGGRVKEAEFRVKVKEQ